MGKYVPIIIYMLRNPLAEKDGDYTEVSIESPKFNDDDGVWVIGDVHGCYETLKLLLSHLPKDANICFVGDLVDRGPRSKEVIDLVMEKGYDCVLGNHDLMFLGTIAQNSDKHANIPIKVPQWATPAFLRNGGFETLKSFGVKLYELDKIPEKYVNWYLSCPIYIKYPVYDDRGQELLVSHSCMASGWDLIDAANNIWSDDGLLWRRMGYGIPQGCFHVFGHSPWSKEPLVKRNHAIIDTGPYYPVEEISGVNKAVKGRLTAFHHPSKQCIQVNRVDPIYEGEEYEMVRKKEEG